MFSVGMQLGPGTKCPLKRGVRIWEYKDVVFSVGMQLGPGLSVRLRA